MAKQLSAQEQKGLAIAEADAKALDPITKARLVTELTSELKAEDKPGYVGKLDLRQSHAYHRFGDVQLWEQPIGSGNMFSGNGIPLGHHKLVAHGHWDKVSDHHVDPSAPKIDTETKPQEAGLVPQTQD